MSLINLAESIWQKEVSTVRDEYPDLIVRDSHRTGRVVHEEQSATTKLANVGRVPSFTRALRNESFPITPSPHHRHIEPRIL